MATFGKQGNFYQPDAAGEVALNFNPTKNGLKPYPKRFTAVPKRLWSDCETSVERLRIEPSQINSRLKREKVSFDAPLQKKMLNQLKGTTISRMVFYSGANFKGIFDVNFYL